jgi:hypothetical protein
MTKAELKSYNKFLTCDRLRWRESLAKLAAELIELDHTLNLEKITTFAKIHGLTPLYELKYQMQAVKIIVVNLR